MSRPPSRPALTVLLLALLLVAWGPRVRAGDQAPPDPALQEAGLVRTEVQRCMRLPWTLAQAALPSTQAGAKPASGPLQISMHDLIIQGFGKIDPRSETKEGVERTVLVLDNDVVIESISSNFVLRARKVQLAQNPVTKRPDYIEAEGQVELCLGDLKAKGQYFRFDTTPHPKTQREQEVVTITGSKERQRPATLWSGANGIQAWKFILDLRLNIYRTQGGVLAEVQLPGAEEEPAAEKPAQPAAMGLPEFKLTGGGKLLFACDGEFHMEASTGEIHINSNAYIQKGDVVIRADKVTVLQDVDPGGVKAMGAGGGLMGGGLKSFECDGRTEISTRENMILCDRFSYQPRQNLARMEMAELKEHIQIFYRDPEQPEQSSLRFRIRHRAAFNTQSQKLEDHYDQAAGDPVNTRELKTIKLQPIPLTREKSIPQLLQLNLNKSGKWGAETAR